MKITVNTLLLVGLSAVVTPVHVEAVRGPAEMIITGLRENQLRENQLRENQLRENQLRENQLRETRVRVLAALQQSGVKVREWSIRITADPPPGASGTIDLAAAVGVLAALGEISVSDLVQTFFVGELSLTGDVRPIRGVCVLVEGAAQHSPTGNMVPKIVVPTSNRVEAIRAARRDGDRVKIKTLARLTEMFEGTRTFFGDVNDGPVADHGKVDFSDVRGMPEARRALEIAAVGEHHVLFIGRRGTGATMLARRLTTILPPRSDREIAETTALASVAGLLRADLGYLPERPFRAPHHTVSIAGLVGGGYPLRPGEVSLASSGVLFLDEMEEFRRDALEYIAKTVLAGAVEHVGHDDRREYRARFPATPIVVGHVAPCPCGAVGSPTERCVCSPERIEAYWGRLRSLPIWDLFDLRVTLAPVDASQIEGIAPGEESEPIRARVREAQRGATPRVHAEDVDGTGKPLRALRNVARAESEFVATRVLHVAQSIARLAGSETVTEAHVDEAKALRSVGPEGKA